MLLQDFFVLLIGLICIYFAESVRSTSLIAEPYPDDSSSQARHIHRRRVTQHDERFLGFRFVEEPVSAVAMQGRAQLNCRHSVSGGSVQSARIEWRKDGTPLSSLRPTAKVLVLPNGSLLIENAGVADEGLYQCVVHVVDKNYFTWTYLSQKATVRLPSLSRFEIQPQDQEVYRGQPVAFRCILESQPKAIVEWYHNDKLLNDAADNTITIFAVSSTLEIGSVQTRHEGTYKCVASNGEKSRTSRKATLRLRPENNVGNDFSEPLFVMEPRGEVVNEGESVVLECLTSGWPKPDIRWLKGSEAVVVDEDRIQRLGLSSLLILKASASDAGVYTCRASNTQESVDSSAAVQVKVAPDIVTKPRDTVAQETTDVQLQCGASGKPGAAVSWFKNGEAIIASEYFVIEAETLRILGLVRNDQGVYQCIAENDAGSAQASAQLLVHSADTFSLAASDGQPRMPSEPLGARVSAVGSRLVTLAWDPPLQRHGSLLAYHVFYKEQGSSRERMTNSSSNSFTVTQLQPDTIYLFRVVAENEAGMGKSTAQLSVTTTKEQAVPGKVKNLQAIAVSAETIEVSWSPPSGGPPALQYKLFYIRKQPELNEKETQIVVKKTSYMLHGMDKYIEYIIRVEAEGANGAGLSSDPVTVRTLSDLPSMPPLDVRGEALSSTSILVQWAPPPAEECNGVITGYRLKYKTKLRGSKGNTLVVDGNANSYTISGLEPSTQYMLRIAAVNQNGSGPNSEWFHVDTPLEDKDEGQVAGPPMSLKVQPSLDSIQLSWLPPRDEGVMIRGYLIGWGINVPDIEQVKVASSLRYYTITGLKPSRDYVISLRAYNVMGNGFPIYETVRTISPGAAPIERGFDQLSEDMSGSQSETPIGVRAESISSSAVRVTWSDTEVDAPYSRQYTVRYSSSAENSGQQRYINSSETEVLIEGLRPNTLYEFAVRVNAGRSSSQWSMTTTNRTLPAPPSSAPRDLTVVQPANGDPHSLTLNWQPPKYGNGEIEEYLIYYSDRSDVPDKDWILDSVKGDRLSITLTNLLPRTTYFFKMQARNVKGYGPLSPVLQYVPGAPPPRLFHNTETSREAPMGSALLSNPLFAGVGIAAVILLLFAVIATFWCVRSKSSKNAVTGGYVQGRKSTPDGKAPPDLWINHPHGQHVRGSDFTGESPSASVSDLKRFDNGVVAVDSPPPRYQTLQDLSASHAGVSRRVPSMVAAYGSVAHPPLNTSAMQCPATRERRQIGFAEPISAHSHPYISDNESNGTLTRSYHQSSSSLEGRQRTPQVVYTGSGRNQPVAKIDFSDQGSSYGSSQALHSCTPPPQLPNQGPPGVPPSQLTDGYRTLRSTNAASNPLKSFTQLAGAPPPLSPLQGERTAHVVRPVVIASPSARGPGGKPAGVVVAQRIQQVPVGRAQAQPRVNVNHADCMYAPYAACGVPEKNLKSRDQVAGETDIQPLQPSNSTEELNAQMENLDTMIDDLQALQHEFSATS